MITLRTKIVRNRMRELSKQGQQAAATWNAKSAETVAKLARQFVPVDTGALRDSIAVELNRATGSASVTAGNAQVPYAAHVEYGTAFQAPQPYLTPAVESVRRGMRNRSVRFYRA